MVASNGHLAIVGSTGCGKSELAMEIARLRPRVELVSMDSMAIYRGMDLGTAKPGLVEQQEIRHHMLDLANPSEEYSLAEFQKMAKAVIADITRRGARALLVGGTGLHVRSLVDDLQIPGRFEAIRNELETEANTGVLHQRLLALDPVAARRTGATNRRRILRALEVTLGSGQLFSSYGPGLKLYKDSPITQVGIRVERSLLDAKLAKRFHEMLESGLLAEVESLLGQSGGFSVTAGQAVGYKDLTLYLRGECSFDEAVENAVRATRRLARRQERWFRRDPRIVWFTVGDDPFSALDELLAVYDGCSA